MSHKALDEEHLKVDAQFGGVDQRKIFVFAEKVTARGLECEVYWPAWEMHCNNLGLVLGLGFVRVSSRVRVRIGVKVRVSVLVRVSIRTSWVVTFALFRCYRPVIYTCSQHKTQTYLSDTSTRDVDN